MKKILYISAFAVVLAGTTLTSCSDFLEAENKSSGGITDDSFFSSNPNYLLTSAYRSMKEFNNQVNLYDEGTDLYANYRVAPSNYDKYIYSAEDGVITSFYQNCYATIKYANGVVKYAGEDSDMGLQARFLRAYTYYVLTQQFGRVPYITSYIQDANRDYPRTDLDEIYGKLSDELTALAQSSLADIDHSSGKPSKQACNALLAKVKLAQAWSKVSETGADVDASKVSSEAQGIFKDAAEAAVKAIGGQGLTMTFEDKWSPYKDGNDEVIFAIKYLATNDAPSDNSNSQHGTYGAYYSPLATCDSQHAQNSKSLYLFEEGDKRYESTFMTTIYDGASIAEAYFAFYTEDATKLASHKIANKYFPYWYTEAEVETWISEHSSQLAKGNTPHRAVLLQDYPVIYNIQDDGATYTKSSSDSYAQYAAGAQSCGVKVRKFDDAVTQGYCFRDVVLMHLSQLYLVAAEAYYMANDQTNFLKYLNAVRQRAGVGDVTTLEDYRDNKVNYSYGASTTFGDIKWIDVILDEYARELYAEKTRWMDLSRTKQLIRYNNEFNTAVGTGSNVQFLRPIPNGAFTNNTGMIDADGNYDQNPGY